MKNYLTGIFVGLIGGFALSILTGRDVPITHKHTFSKWSREGSNYYELYQFHQCTNCGFIEADFKQLRKPITD